MIDVLVLDDDFRVADVHAAYVARVPGFRVTGTAGRRWPRWSAVPSTCCCSTTTCRTRPVWPLCAGCGNGRWPATS